MADTQLGALYGSVTRPRVSVRGWTGLFGAAMSLALVLGIGVWGYKLILRDVNGIPVIRAIEGPMRVQPADPGGTRMAHQGLSVNEVAAAGEAGQISASLVLAPDAPRLREHDLPAAQLPERGAIELSPAAEAVSEPSGSGTAGPSDIELAVAAVVASAPMAPVEVIPASVPGVSRSLIPPTRPGRMLRTPSAAAAAEAAVPVAAVVAAPAGAAPGSVDVNPDLLPVGSRLVQLGAFDSLEKARDEWDSVVSRFSEVMAGKGRVIQEASANGATFYRLRVSGFADLADARRFCATLTADRSRPLCVPAAIR